MAALFKGICVVVTLIFFITVWYRQDRLMTAWLSENRHLPLTTRWRLSATVMWSRKLSPQCRELRRKDLIAEGGYLIWFLFLFVVMVISN